MREQDEKWLKLKEGKGGCFEHSALGTRSLLNTSMAMHEIGVLKRCTSFSFSFHFYPEFIKSFRSAAVYISTAQHIPLNLMRGYLISFCSLNFLKSFIWIELLYKICRLNTMFTTQASCLRFSQLWNYGKKKKEKKKTLSPQSRLFKPWSQTLHGTAWILSMPLLYRCFL